MPLPEASAVDVSGRRGFGVCPTTDGERKWFHAASDVDSSGVCSRRLSIGDMLLTFGVRRARGELTPAAIGMGVLSNCVPLDRTDFAAGRLAPVDILGIGVLALSWTDLPR